MSGPLAGPCPVTGCAEHVPAGVLLCVEHRAMLPLPWLCALRRAWRSGDLDAYGTVAVQAVAALNSLTRQRVYVN